MSDTNNTNPQGYGANGEYGVALQPVAYATPKRPEQNGVKRPGDNTICGKIWAFCDAALQQQGAPPTVKQVKAWAGVAIDHTTCNVQYYRWRAFKGYRGRIS